MQKRLAEARQRGAQAQTRPVQTSFAAASTTTILLNFGFPGRSLNGALKELSEAVEKETRWWPLRRMQTAWGRELKLKYVTSCRGES